MNHEYCCEGCGDTFTGKRKVRFCPGCQYERSLEGNRRKRREKPRKKYFCADCGVQFAGRGPARFCFGCRKIRASKQHKECNDRERQKGKLRLPRLKRQCLSIKAMQKIPAEQWYKYKLERS